MYAVSFVTLMMMHWSVMTSNRSAFAAHSDYDDEVDKKAHGTLIDDIKVTSCVTNCTCLWPSTADPRIIIDCIDRTRGNSSSVAEEINRLLAGRESELTDLTIINSALEFVPLSICRLTHLKRLTLNTNKLTSLPSKCFNNMTSLVDFYATDNSLTEIQVIRQCYLKDCSIRL